MIRFKLCFPLAADKVEEIVVDKFSGENFIKSILMIFDRIDCEKHTELYIDFSNKNQFLADYAALESLIDTRIGAFKLEETINTFIVANSIKPFTEKIVIDYTFTLLNTFEQIDAIFKEVNKTRTLNRNDFRHCENHPARIHDKSPLIDGIGGFDNAEKHLIAAIGDSKTRKHFLVNIDCKNKPFILRYEDENLNNKYHAFHIVKAGNPYEVDGEKLRALLNSRLGIPRAMRLIKFRGAL